MHPGPEVKEQSGFIKNTTRHPAAKQALATKTIVFCRFCRLQLHTYWQKNLIEAVENPLHLTSSSPVMTQCHIPEFVRPHLRLLTQAESPSSAPQ